MQVPITLQAVDAVDVTVLVDNVIDVLVPGTDLARRPARHWGDMEREQLRAEHGYSLAIEAQRGERRVRLLYDVGFGHDTVVHNMEVLGVDPKAFQTLVLSHGHRDHHGGLNDFAARVGRSALPIVLHPHALRERKMVFPNGEEMHLPPPSLHDLEREGWQVVEESGASLLFDGMVLVTGQIERVTEFEQGLRAQRALVEGEWQPDPLVCDDQAIVLHLAGKGLVILSSCSHSGGCNVVRHAQRLTGVERVHALIGGLHLTNSPDDVIKRTVEELMIVAPDVLVPGHCTGTAATYALRQAFPNAFEPTNVGTTFHLQAAS